MVSPERSCIRYSAISELCRLPTNIHTIHYENSRYFQTLVHHNREILTISQCLYALSNADSYSNARAAVTSPLWSIGATNSTRIFIPHCGDESVTIVKLRESRKRWVLLQDWLWTSCALLQIHCWTLNSSLKRSFRYRTTQHSNSLSNNHLLG